MSDDSQMVMVPTAKPTQHSSRLFPIPRLNSLIALVVVGFLVVALFTGLTMQFYASFLFLFYSLTKSMWVSVMMLGIFQTILLVPFRIINLLKSANIKEFKEMVDRVKFESQQQYLIKTKVKKGENLVLFYVVNFFVQIISYFSIGRLFLTDFYTVKLNPKLLYSFVSYPNYPLQDRWFKLPYAWFTDTVDFGMGVVLGVWGVLIFLQLGVYAFMYFSRRMKKASQEEAKNQSLFRQSLKQYSTGYLVVLLLISWWVIRHFPIAWEFRIFSGDVSVPNRTMNAITAIATFFTLIWINLPKINKKVQLAVAAGFETKVINRTQKALFTETFRVATFVGLGAFFITNLIPSAFELSIFTLEIISWTAPFTLDKVILRKVGEIKDNKEKEEKKKEDKGKEEVSGPEESG